MSQEYRYSIDYASIAPKLLERQGPMVEIYASVHPAVAADCLEKAIPVPGELVIFLIDTGSALSSVSSALAKKLGLTPIRFIEMTGTVGQPEQRPVHRASLTLQLNDGKGNNVPLTHVIQVVELEELTPHQGLLGRDFLSRVVFYYSGITEKIEITFKGTPGTVVR